MKQAAELKKKKTVITISVVAVLVITAVISVAAVTSKDNAKSAKAGATAQITEGQGITIQKKNVTSKAQFLAYTSGGIKMEVVAVRAPDGTIRTAFNTCQVCFSSGRGYYIQVNDELVCQNCGNRFKISRVELEKNGCNPVPILKGEKEDTADTVFIPDSVMSSNSNLFANWKTR